eukprot:366130-Chlamydomonas_euryale.AAC.18
METAVDLQIVRPGRTRRASRRSSPAMGEANSRGMGRCAAGTPLWRRHEAKSASLWQRPGVACSPPRSISD